jgi:hypothetical protein
MFSAIQSFTEVLIAGEVQKEIELEVEDCRKDHNYVFFWQSAMCVPGPPSDPIPM